MSDYTVVMLSGPDRNTAELRIYPEHVQVHFGQIVAVGSGSLKSLYAALLNRRTWHGGNVSIETSWLIPSKVVVKINPLDRPVVLVGAREALIQAVEDVFAANV